MFIQNLYTKCRMHGAGDAQVVLSDDELYALICISIDDLDWSFCELGVNNITIDLNSYYETPLSWFDDLTVDGLTSTEVKKAISNCFNKNNDFALYLENICALHRRRTKYRRILSKQPLPTMDQIGPRVLLEYGECDSQLLAHWMLWRKWIYDIDNRSAQETGYLFEPLLAGCLGGESIGARNSPVKRLDANGNQTNKGRQIDCFVPNTNKAFELKLRVTIAASGQGRFGEELSFPVEAMTAGFIPILLVLDPTPSSRLTELSSKFIACGGEFYQGDDAWNYMEQEAGIVISVFIDKYIKPVITNIEDIDIDNIENITLNWSEDQISISSNTDVYTIYR